jgi:HEPN domain-containing protein
MRNRHLAGDYVQRAKVRLRAIDVLYEAQSWADVVRQSQEVVELALKGLLRASGIEPPRIHDVSALLVAEREQLPGALRPEVERLAAISHELRRDEELALYGAEDLTPSSFYSQQDAVRARDSAAAVVVAVEQHVLWRPAIGASVISNPFGSPREPARPRAAFAPTSAFAPPRSTPDRPTGTALARRRKRSSLCDIALTR